MAVLRYRTIEEMPPIWTRPDDPDNLRRVARMLGLHARLTGGVRQSPGVRRFRSIEDANPAGDDPYRCAIGNDAAGSPSQRDRDE
jgi:hypothetical protein